MLFDRNLYTHRIKRHKVWQNKGDFLLSENADEVIERLNLMCRDFNNVLVLGDYSGLLTRKLHFHLQNNTHTPLKKNKIKNLVRQNLFASSELAQSNTYHEIVVDEERIFFEQTKYDAVISFLSMQFINDLPGHLKNILQFLVPDGLLLVCFVGGESLKSLRNAFLQVEMETMDGVSARIIPFIDVRTFGDLLHKVGYKMIVTDTQKHVYNYTNFDTILQDIRELGWANNLVKRSVKGVKKNFFKKVKDVYKNDNKDVQENKKYSVTYDIIWACCWSAGPNQPQPLKPGSAQISLADVLKTSEDKGKI